MRESRGPQGAEPLEHDGIVYRPLERDRGEHEQAVALQDRIWAPDVATPVPQLIAAESCGGLVIGAFDGAELVGFCYGFPAHRDGMTWLHSHQTGVDESYRDRGIGETLKWRQRDLAVAVGYRRITWTFDPLQSRNAHVNLAKLGAYADAYEVNYYGELSDEMNRGVASDRLWVTWPITSRRVRAHLWRFLTSSGADWPALAAVDADETEDGEHDPVGGAGPADGDPALVTEASAEGTRRPTGEVRTDLATPAVLIETPADLDAVRSEIGDDAARAWRREQRRAFLAYLDRGYVVVGFRTDEEEGARRSWYVLGRRDDVGEE